MTPEQHIRRALDGTLTRINRDGGVVVERVALDFIPSHLPTKYNFRSLDEDEDGPPPAPLKPPRTPWTTTERREICALLARGLSRRAIAARVGRSYSSIGAMLFNIRWGRT